MGCEPGSVDAPVPAAADRAALAAWAQLPSCGPATLWRVLAAGDVADQFARLQHGTVSVEATRADVARRWVTASQQLDVAMLAAERSAASIGISVFGDAGHPPSCWMDPYLPPLLFTMGPALARGAEGIRSVAIVGTRQASGYGLGVATELGARCAAGGIRVVSGLALGIDAAAHAGALDASGVAPLGVVGSGLDRPYPKRNRPLWQRVAASGVLVSEYPPGRAPARWQFPARNRIVVGCADVVVVVESHERGGALGTAQLAAERGVPVLAVPGSIRSPTSRGTNALLADGAAPCRGLDDVMSAVGLVSDGQRAAMMAVDATIDRTTQEQQVLDALGWERQSLESIGAGCSCSDGELATALLTLQVDGVVRNSDGLYERVSHSVRDS